MDNVGAGTGLAALGFWLFIAATVVAGVWDTVRKREARHETLRRVIESGQPVDPLIMDKLLGLAGERQRSDRDMHLGGVVLGVISVGLAVFGWVLGITLAPELWDIMLGVALLMGFISGGLFAGAALIRHWNRQGQRSDAGP